MIRHTPKGWVVVTKDGKRRLGGPYPSKKDAVRRLAQVEGHARSAQSTVLVNDYQAPVINEAGTDPEDDRTAAIILPLLPTLSAEVGKVIAGFDGAVDAEELHVTLFFLGAVKDIPTDRLLAARNLTATAAKYLKPMTGKIGGIGYFAPTESSDNKVVVYAIPDVEGLVDLRREMAMKFEAAHVPFHNAPDGGEWVPHCTLAYVDAGQPDPPGGLVGMPLKFSELRFCAGDDDDNFPLGDQGQEIRITQSHPTAATAPWVSYSARGRSLTPLPRGIPAQTRQMVSGGDFGGLLVATVGPPTNGQPMPVLSVSKASDFAGASASASKEADRRKQRTLVLGDAVGRYGGQEVRPVLLAVDPTA